MVAPAVPNPPTWVRGTGANRYGRRCRPLARAFRDGARHRPGARAPYGEGTRMQHRSRRAAAPLTSPGRGASARRRGLRPRPARGRGLARDGGAGRAALSLALTPPAGGRVPASSLQPPRTPTAPPGRSPNARAEDGGAPRRLGGRAERAPPCPCPPLPSGDVCPAPLRSPHRAPLYPSRSRRPRGLSPCARPPRCAPQPSGRGPAGVARPRNSMQLGPPLARLLPGASAAAGGTERAQPGARAELGFWAVLPAPRLRRGSGAPTPTSPPRQWLPRFPSSAT